MQFKVVFYSEQVCVEGKHLEEDSCGRVMNMYNTQREEELELELNVNTVSAADHCSGPIHTSAI